MAPWSQRGQASVEAALLLPTTLLLLALLMQPACLLYTRCVMEGAAVEVARLAATAREGFDVRPFALRRLAAVPEVSVFHVGGQQDWEVSTEGPDERGLVKVLLSGHARSLPLLGGICGLLGESDEKGLVLEARVTASTRPDWLEGSYEDWVGMWR